jgi:hypothetical protein
MILPQVHLRNICYFEMRRNIPNSFYPYKRRCKGYYCSAPLLSRRGSRGLGKCIAQHVPNILSPSPTMKKKLSPVSKMSVLRLSPAEILEAVYQIFTNPTFRTANTHLTEAELVGIFSLPPQWPASPVFSPFATTHDGYSQIRYKGTKYLTHRLTYQQHWADLDLALDISHTLYLGDRTTK